MKEKIRELFPEIEWIHDEEMRGNVVAAIEDALKAGGWEPEDMGKIPFTLLIPNCPFSYLDHVRGVTRVAKLAMDEFNAIYAAKDEKFRMNNDLLVAGALLHDVGKLVEYARNDAGETVKSRCGKNLRHPFSGTVIALRNGLPDEVAHHCKPRARGRRHAAQPRSRRREQGGLHQLRVGKVVPWNEITLYGRDYGGGFRQWARHR